MNENAFFPGYNVGITWIDGKGLRYTLSVPMIYSIVALRGSIESSRSEMPSSGTDQQASVRQLDEFGFVSQMVGNFILKGPGLPIVPGIE